MNQSGRSLFLPIFLTLLAAWLFWSLSRPFVLTRRLKMEIRPLQVESKRLEQENPLLEQRLNQAETPETLEREAHRAGWIKPGERRLVFLPPPSAAQPEVIRPPARGPSLFSRMRDWARKTAKRIL